MAEILWLAWQLRHIQARHGITAREFEEAWDDPGREDLESADQDSQGPYVLSVGSTSDGRVVVMLWRWQQRPEGRAVWPITAYFQTPRRRSRRRRQR